MVEVVGGSLIVTGDELANDIKINQVGVSSPDEFVVESGPSATTINGQAGSIAFDGVTNDLRIKLNDGNDKVQLDFVNVPRDLQVSGGEGSNVVLMSICEVQRNLRVDHGNGFDQFSAFFVGVGGKVQVSNGDGSSTTSISNSTFQGSFDLKTDTGFANLTITGSHLQKDATIRSEGSGTNTFEQVAIDGRLIANHGVGSEVWNIKDSTISGDVRISYGVGPSEFNSSDYATFGGKVTIRAGEGYNKFLASYSDFAKQISVSNGAGGSRTAISGSTLGGDLAISSGDGLDKHTAYGSTILGSVRIDARDGGTEGDAIFCSIAKDFSLKSGAGDDNFYTYGVTLVGNVTISTGRGTDDLRLENTRVQKRLSISGSEVLDVKLTTVKVIGATLVRTGQQADEISIDDSEFSGPVTLLTRGGADIVQIERVDTGRFNRTVFYGSTRISLGTGDDVVFIGASDTAMSRRSARFWTRPRFDGGSGIDTLGYQGFANALPLGPPTVRGIEFVF